MSAVTLCEELDELPIFCLGVDAPRRGAGLIRGIEVSSDPPEGEHIGAEAKGRILPRELSPVVIGGSGICLSGDPCLQA